MPPSLKQYFKRNKKIVDSALNRYLHSKNAKPTPIYEAMRYSLFAGGKRLRPILVFAAAEVCGGSSKNVLPTACAVELIHTYSLIHDDLPSMDDDDLRRGKPTSHRKFGEDIAILAGDALLTFAFELMAQNASIKGIRPENVVKAVQVMAQGAGPAGMVGGQVADIKADKGRWKKLNAKSLLQYIHMNKTAALIRSSLVCGAILSRGTKTQINALDRYGLNLGLAFQITDDILDRVGDKKKLGKKGSDVDNDKLTYPRIYGLEKSRKLAESHIKKAVESISQIKLERKFFSELAQYILEREY